MPLHLVSVNIERAKHLERVLPFVEREKPHVLCLQEVLERDVPRFASLVGDHTHFAGMTVLQGMDSPSGIALISRYQLKDASVHYYRGLPGQIPVFDETSVDTKYRTERMMFLGAEVIHGEKPFQIGTTHFTWTPDGKPDDYQRRDLAALIPILKDAGELVFAGDFNAPRGGEIFRALSKHWKDNIPPEYETSIDVELHRAGKTRADELKDKMVDGLFTTPSHIASGVRLVSGVSDHMAIVADITKG
jgi:endonuclease/exonuclease/phosphatase family metal-dependent hydrolase